MHEERRTHHGIGDDLDFAVMLASAGGRIAAERFRHPGLDVQTKLDGSPVTDADRDVERELTRLIRRWRPGDAILGEEFGVTEGTNDRRWIIDPIDGTAHFVSGDAGWGVLVALEIAGRISAGVVVAPLLDISWWAARGLGARRNGERLRARDPNPGDGLIVSRRASHLAGEMAIHESMAGVIASAAVVNAAEGFWPELLIAEGAVDVDICTAAHLWDLAPRQIIVEEAGGVFTDMTGTARSDGGSSLTCSTRDIHRRMLDGVPHHPERNPNAATSEAMAS